MPLMLSLMILCRSSTDTAALVAVAIAAVCRNAVAAGLGVGSADKIETLAACNMMR
jgi:hypothetical protein